MVQWLHLVAKFPVTVPQGLKCSSGWPRQSTVRSETHCPVSCCFVSYRGLCGSDLRKHDLAHGELKARVEMQKSIEPPKRVHTACPHLGESDLPSHELLIVPPWVFLLESIYQEASGRHKEYHHHQLPFTFTDKLLSERQEDVSQGQVCPCEAILSSHFPKGTNFFLGIYYVHIVSILS